MLYILYDPILDKEMLIGSKKQCEEMKYDLTMEDFTGLEIIPKKEIN